MPSLSFCDFHFVLRKSQYSISVPASCLLKWQKSLYLRAMKDFYMPNWLVCIYNNKWQKNDNDLKKPCFVFTLQILIISYTVCIEHKYYLATQDVQGHISSKLSSSVEVNAYHIAQCSSDITAAHPAPLLFDQS